MLRTVSVLALLLAGSVAASAQENLNEQQRHGRQLLAQSCGVCHLPPALNAKTYGPPLPATQVWSVHPSRSYSDMHCSTRESNSAIKPRMPANLAMSRRICSWLPP